MCCIIRAAMPIPYRLAWSGRRKWLVPQAPPVLTTFAQFIKITTEASFMLAEGLLLRTHTERTEGLPPVEPFFATKASSSHRTARHRISGRTRPRRSYNERRAETRRSADNASWSLPVMLRKSSARYERSELGCLCRARWRSFSGPETGLERSPRSSGVGGATLNDSRTTGSGAGRPRIRLWPLAIRPLSGVDKDI